MSHLIRENSASKDVKQEKSQDSIEQLGLNGIKCVYQIMNQQRGETGGSLIGKSQTSHFLTPV